MRQTIRMRFMRLLSCIAVIGVILGTCILASCSEKNGAVLVNKDVPSCPVDYSDVNNWMKQPEITRTSTPYISIPRNMSTIPRKRRCLPTSTKRL